jgi:hydroxymethylglutaryl-CoA lyase
MKYQLTFPKRVEIGDLTVRDGMQALEHIFTTEEKLAVVEDLILAGFEHVEVTNFGHPKYLPQFADAEEMLERLFQSKRVGHLLKQNGGKTLITAITINERACTRALDFKAKHGVGPDIVLQMVSTDPVHHKTNSGMSLDDYWKMTERCTKMVNEQGIQMCGTVSTIWGSPMEGARVTDLKRAVEFSKIYLDLGASYIEQADHDGSADPARVYEYFSMILDPDLTGKWADPKYHLAHFHTSRGMGLANVLAALQAGMIRFESTLSGIGGQPANMIDGRLVSGTGKYYHKEHLLSGLVTTEDLVVMMESMGIDTGVDILKLLDIGRKFRDKYLYISPAQMNAIITAVSEFTGISNDRLVNLRESDKELGNFVEEAVKFLVKPGEEEPKRIRESLMQLFNSLSGYLRRGMWAVSRAETIVSDVPPSPFLKDLL